MMDTINLNNEKISVDEDYTVVLGKFEENEIDKYKEKEVDQINKVLSEIERISLVDFIKIFENDLKDFTEYKTGFRILDIVQEFHSIMETNLASLETYIKLIEELKSLMNYLELKQTKNTLSNDLKLAKLKHKSNTISAKTDLLEKLTQAIKKNKKNLAYLKEDYYKYKNQVNQIKSHINEKKKQIQNLNKKKKQCFRRINSITRQMEGKKQANKNKTDLGGLIDDDTSLSKSDRILALQKQARECQYGTKKIRKEINEKREALNEILPKYEKLENDFNKLKESIEKDKERKSEIQEELNQALSNEKDLQNIDIKEIDVAKSPEQLRREIESITRKINQFETQYPDFQKKPKDVFASVREQFQILKEKLSSYSEIDQNLIEKAREEIGKIRTLDQYLLDLEKTINVLIKEIHLVSNFKIKFNKNELSIYLSFIRKGKEKIDIKGLTTPERVYFGICFYLSCFIVLGREEIVFSNLFLPANFNKRGSLFRTIRKTIPVFEQNPPLNTYKLIYLISKLHMKRQIKNTKVINLINKNNE
ncbi:MAG: hypothetical protein R6U96_12160 [Promethearchaeia archaeon]